ncbi:MAG: hypothetical protein ACOZNI_16975 [Myxococcota bacterium]
MIALFWSGAAWACPVCGAATSNDQSAYLAMTVFLSLLPLGLIGGTAWWAWTRASAGADAP